MTTTSTTTDAEIRELGRRWSQADGSFRATHIAVRRDGRWRLAGIHMSPVGGPPPFAATPDRRADPAPTAKGVDQ
jgi:hypothetical protein